MPNSCLAKHQAVGVNRRARSLICRISPKPSHSVQIKPSNILLALTCVCARRATVGSATAVQIVEPKRAWPANAGRRRATRAAELGGSTMPVANSSTESGRGKQSHKNSRPSRHK